MSTTTPRPGKLLLGVDIGTGSSKGVLTDTEGMVLATSEQPHDLSLPRPGWAEHDAEDVWWADFTAICTELVAEAGDAEICGISVSGIGPCILFADEQGNPLRPAILYGIDTRSMAEVAEISERYGEATITKHCGNPLNAQSIGARMLWLQRQEPEVWQRTRYWFMASSFVAFRLTGAYVLDHVSASYSEPLYDVGSGEWTPWAAELGDGLEMPELKWPSDVVGHVTAEAAERTGLPEGCPVVAGTMDSLADAMSVGVRKPGDAVVIYGSTMSIFLVTDEFLPSRQLWSNAHLFEGTNNLASGMATSGSLTKWLRDLIGPGVDFGGLSEEAAAVPPGSHGLLALPYFAGERTPLHDPDARGVIAGLTLNHGRGHLYRALMEATAYGARHVLDVMQAAGGHSTRAYAVGGGTKAGLWPQIVSDVTGLTQEITEQSVGACYGDAMLAGVGVGLLDADADWTTVTGLVEPDPQARQTYDVLYGMYRELHRATEHLQHGLAHLQAQEESREAPQG